MRGDLLKVTSFTLPYNFLGLSKFGGDKKYLIFTEVKNSFELQVILLPILTFINLIIGTSDVGFLIRTAIYKD